MIVTTKDPYGFLKINLLVFTKKRRKKTIYNSTVLNWGNDHPHRKFLRHQKVVVLYHKKSAIQQTSTGNRQRTATQVIVFVEHSVLMRNGNRGYFLWN